MEMKSWSLLIFILTCFFSFGKSNWENKFLVYPERIHNTRHKRDLSTNYQGKHEHKATYKLKDYIIDLQKAENPHAGTINVRSYDDKTGEAKHEDFSPEECHYQGKIRGIENSHVHLSTCEDQLSGTIQNGEELFSIEHVSDDLHRVKNIVKEIKDLNEQLKRNIPLVPKKNTKSDNSKEKYHETMDLSKNNDVSIAKDKKYEKAFNLYNVESQYIPYLKEPTRVRYVEMLICTHRTIYEHYGRNKSRVINKVLSALTQLDKTYSVINVRIVVVAIDVLTKEEWGKDSNLGGFGTHYRYLKAHTPFKDIRTDNAQFFSPEINGGLAWQGAMCSLGAVAINSWWFGTLHAAFVVGHEFGHNLNMPHDYENCKCLTSKGCVMGGWKTALNGFSNCSLIHMGQKKKWCWNDYPTTNLNPRCGNGIQEGDEECDCGTEEMCRNKGDNCCRPYGCTLRVNAQCSHLNHPDCCSKQCLFKRHGTLCRESSSTCDTPEYCTGESAECPQDLFRSNGQHCGYKASFLDGPTGWWKSNYAIFNPKVNGRYVRFSPQFWSKGGKACMHVQIFGCPTLQDLSGLETGFYTGPGNDKQCIVPDSNECENIPDNTKLKFKAAGVTLDCHHQHMLYKLLANGTMIHSCSGKKICTLDNDELVISSQCQTAKSKFEFQKKSYRQVSSGKCINTYLSSPGGVVKIIDCNLVRYKLHQTMQDCLINLVSKLPDSSFTSNSVYKGYVASNARMNSSGWCGDLSNKKNFLQIDLGHEYSIYVLTVKGRWRNYVHSYHFQYSTDGQHWTSYKKSGESSVNGHNYCYEGTCIRSIDYQCKDLWSHEASVAAESCWNKNVIQNDYGTCSISSNVPCSQKNKFCGQIQCNAKLEKPHYIDYAKSYKKQVIGQDKCSLAAIIGNEQRELGMVEEGSKCAEGKICVRQECKTLDEHGFKTCIKVNGTLCNKKGVCRNDGTCLCEGNLNPADGCRSALAPVNGFWKSWSSWTQCEVPCGGGTRKRFRFCTLPKHGGEECQGEKEQSKLCNNESCPVEKSCKLLKRILEMRGKTPVDGIYEIEPRKGVRVQTYCDMTRNGGGWTLIVSADTNQWTEKNVWLKNEQKASLRHDFSILRYANDIKHNPMVGDTSFEYRLEANEFNHWGGIWRAPVYYNISSTNKYQVDVELVEKFDNWTAGGDSIHNRIPYVNKYCLTTSDRALNVKKKYGSITDINPSAHPSYWIKGYEKIQDPLYVWYWFREGDISVPKSCLDIKKRGRQFNEDFPSGIYHIQPSPNGEIVKTYCDMSHHGGGWTLVLKSKSKNGLHVNVNNEVHPNAENYSIWKFSDIIKDNQKGEDTFNYIIETDGHMSGVNSADVSSPLLCPNLSKETIEIDIHSSSQNTLKVNCEKNCGIVVSGSKLNQQPSIIKIWMREGGSRKSCNDIVVQSHHKGVSGYKNGFYMLTKSLLVYCDMERDNGEGWTLLVTSTNSGWTNKTVLWNHGNKPSLASDYSILRYANEIKSLSNGSSFKYMLDAEKRGRWGGIYEADIEYSFLGTSPNNPTKQLHQFDKWEKNSNWKGINSRMPWLGNAAHGRALLTTSVRDDYDESGTICANDPAGFSPARWIYPEMKNPGVIWYWMNENDCQGSLRRVDGQYSQWSEWTPCLACNQGNQTRKRDCVDPIPRCGGKPCMKKPTFQERRCQELCQETRITSPDSNFCLEPESGKCSPPINTRLYYRSVLTHCQDNSSLFVYDTEKGTLVHSCSGIPVCADKLGWLGQIVISPTCKNINYQIYRTVFGSLQFGDSFCNDPIGGLPFKNKKVVLWKECDVPRKKLLFTTIGGASSVLMEMYEYGEVKSVDSLLTQQGYPSSPYYSGYLDLFASTPDIGSNYQARLTTFFHVPMTGYYTFYMACDDYCRLNIGQVAGAQGRNNKKTIINVDGYISGRFNFYEDDNQRSEKLYLRNGEKYFLEGILIELGGGDFISVGCVLPDKTKLFPITERFLTHRIIP